MVAQLLSHQPAEFTCPGRIVFVCLAELEIATGSVRPPWRGRINLLEHGQRQLGTPGCEMLPDSRIGEKRGQFLLAPPLRPRRQPAPRVGHVTQPGREIGRHGLDPGAPRRRQPGVDEDIPRAPSPSIVPAAASSGPARLYPMRIAGWPAALSAIT